jgi:uncharacterized protein (TIGR02118 family)
MVDKVIAVVRGGREPHNRPAGAGLHHEVRLQPTEGEPGADTSVEAIWMWWVDDARSLEVSGLSTAYVVDERPQWGPEERGGVTRLSFLRAAPGLTRAQFGDHWRDVHTPLARRHHPNIVRYTQNIVLARLTPETPPVDGIAELTFLSVTDMHARRYDSEEGRRIVGEDVRRFIDLSAGWRVLVAERQADGNTF